MNFGEILEKLQQGKIVRRSNWREELVVFMQIPASIDSEQTWYMKSLPNDMKILCRQNNLGISYQNQFIIYDMCDKTATYHTFDGEDINGEDWIVIDPFTYTV